METDIREETIMSKKDFEAIANVIANEMGFAENDYTANAIAEVARGIADVCQESNHRFDRDQFLDACGVVVR